jgi:hypothetical protein
MAKEVGFSGAAPTQQAAATPEAKRPDVFTICEAPDSKGVTRCHEMGRAGAACQVVLYKGSDIVWRDNAPSTCNAADQKQRDDYFAGKPVGGEPIVPSSDPRAAQLQDVMASLPAKCQQELKSFLYNSRDSSGSRAAEQKAMKSFQDINGSAECKQGYERLATVLGVQVPQRRLAARSRSDWGDGLKDKPRETVNLPSEDRMPSGYYAADPRDNTGGGWDTGEVINNGIQILGILSDLLGAAVQGYAAGGGFNTYSSGGGGGYTSRPAGAAHTYGQGSPSGTGYVYRSNSQSTITGGSR